MKKAIPILPEGYAYETTEIQCGRMIVKMASHSDALALITEEAERLEELVRRLKLKEIAILYANGSKHYRVRAKMRGRLPYVNYDLLGGYNTEDIERLVEEINRYNAPAYLVSMDLHRNLMCNDEGLKLMDANPKQLWDRYLPTLWVPPSKIKPINYKRVQLPPFMQEMHSSLKRERELRNHRYENWWTNGENTEAEWSRWQSDILYRELKTPQNKVHNTRIMVCWENEKVIY